jgi:hypothetical protein
MGGVANGLPEVMETLPVRGSRKRATAVETVSKVPTIRPRLKTNHRK